MSWWLTTVLVLAVGAAALAQDDQQQIQQFPYGVKGGVQQHGGSGGRANYANFFGNHTQGGYNMRHNLTAPAKLDVGVCFIEVPTASLVRDPKHIPAGNGSSPELSRIRSCCKGYIRNIHNFYKCDPVCTSECVNALCTAPDVCTCFPDHVKNLAGFCIPTCPIGCQNGHCNGKQCLCKEGFKKLTDGEFCVPNCKENCGGLGNCTAPNTCDCKRGYESTPSGSCRPACEHCINGDCVAPGDCRCHQGYAKDQRGGCAPTCGVGFQQTPDGQCRPACEHCSNGDCIAPNECRCRHGYTKDQRDLCVPSCVLDCGPTSKCIAPNICDPPLRNLPFQPHPYQPGQPQPNQPFQPGQPQPSQPYHPGQPQPNQPYQPGQPQPNQPFQPGQAPNQQPGSNQLYPNLPNQQFVNNNPNQPSVYPIYSDNQFQGSNNQVQGSNNQGGQCSEGGQPCLNGACVNGRCTCNTGYVIDRNDASGTRCIPDCPGGCPNGICSAPHFCICSPGYYKDHSVKGHPSCVKRAKRSAEEPLNVAELLVFEIPEDEAF